MTGTAAADIEYSEKYNDDEFEYRCVYKIIELFLRKSCTVFFFSFFLFPFFVSPIKERERVVGGGRMRNVVSRLDVLTSSMRSQEK